jgi:sulfide:quinone oxidoreductase
MGSSSTPRSYGGLRVLVAGGGVAGLETLLALHELAGDLVDLELLAPEPWFWYRPLAVGEPFGVGRAEHFELAAIAEAAGATFTLGELASVDAHDHVARTSHGAEVPYDALVVACGARPVPVLRGALTFRGPADTERLRELVDDAVRGEMGSLVFAVPAAGVWPLPLYELALLTALELARNRTQVDLALVTPETAPLSLFGDAPSEAVGDLLAARGVRVYTGSYPSRYEAGRLHLVPGESIGADRVVALPRLEGQRILGLPQDDNGFIATDLHGRVPDVDDVYAAGDVTHFPVKQGGIAAQQADAVAHAIACRAGAVVSPSPFEPLLRGVLLTGGEPLYLRHDLRGGRGGTGEVAADPLWWPPAKIVGRYLGPHLARVAERSTPVESF